MAIKSTSKTLGIYCLVETPIIKSTKESFSEFGKIQDFAPHLSLYSIPIPESNIEISRESVKENVSILKSFSIELGKVNVKQDGYTYISIGGEVDNVHNQLMEMFNQLREDYLRIKDLDRFNDGKISKSDWEFISKYGYIFNGDKYFPHITIGFADKRTNKLLDMMADLSKEIEGTTIDIQQIEAGVYNDVVSDKYSDWDESIKLL